MPKTQQSSNNELDVKDEFFQIRDRYKEQSKRRGTNFLIYGDFGSGKTRLLHTCPQPILVHSFDPGGSVTLRKWIREGSVLVDSRFEREEDERGDPKAYKDWEDEFNRLRKLGFFDHVGTYAIDSVTTMSESLMNAIMSRNNKQKPFAHDMKTYIPQQRDYLVQQYTLRDVLNICTGLPCNFVCIGHIDRSQDEVTGQTIATPMITGKFAQKVPMLFDEVYVTDTKLTSGGPEYRLLTQSTSIYRVRSRLAEGGDLDMYEQPDIKQIMDKTNTPYEDKPLFKTQEQQTH